MLRLNSLSTVVTEGPFFVYNLKSSAAIDIVEVLSKSGFAATATAALLSRTRLGERCQTHVYM